MRSIVLLTTILLTGAPAAELVLPSPSFERDAKVTVMYRTTSQATGKAALSIEWTDILGRVVTARHLALDMTDETEIRFPLDLGRASAMLNQLRAHFVLDGTRRDGKPDHRDERAEASFIARPLDREWWDYNILMWQPHSPEQFATLKTLGINAGQYSGSAKTPPEFLLKNDLRGYAENIATDFYSEYHRYRADRIQNWSFLEAKDLYRRNPSTLEAFKRHPSLSDPAWQSAIRDRLVEAARSLSPYRPVFYDLGDESGIADLASVWDFDFSDYSIGEMREWLKVRYGTLAALNRQWGTSFGAWTTVMPDTTRAAMSRVDENYSSWSDHKEWMDVAYARALRMGVDAVRSVDPDAYVAIAGAQMPGWGGYDYARLSQAVTAVEPYDIGNNIEILRSLNPRLPFVTTAFARGPWEKHRIWYELLHGARGNIIWDENGEFVSPQNTPGERGREVQPYYNELRGGLGALLIQSVRAWDPIAIHYSQASMRAEWMRAQRSKGDAWVNRTSATERMDSEFLRVRESLTKLVEDLGLQYRFVSYGQVEDGELLRSGYRVLILPRSSALSAAEAREIRAFVDQGGLLIADGEPGVFDEHVRRLPKSSLADVKITRIEALSYLQDRLVQKEAAERKAFAKLMEQAGVRPRFTVLDNSNQAAMGVETHTFRNGGVTIVGLLTNPQLRVDELGPPEFKSNQRFERPISLRMLLPVEGYIYDLRAAKPLGPRKELSFTLDPYEPALFAFTAEPLPEFQVPAPLRVARGETARAAIRFSTPTPAATHVLHVDVLDPSGKPVSHYSGNLLAPGGAAAKAVPFAHNDAKGRWTIRVRDVLSGQERSVTVDVE